MSAKAEHIIAAGIFLRASVIAGSQFPVTGTLTRANFGELDALLSQVPVTRRQHVMPRSGIDRAAAAFRAVGLRHAK